MVVRSFSTVSLIHGITLRFTSYSLSLSLSDLFLDKSGINEVAMEMMNEGIAAKRKGWLWIYDTSIATKFEEDPGVREMLSEMQTLRRP